LIVHEFPQEEAVGLKSGVWFTRDIRDNENPGFNTGLKIGKIGKFGGFASIAFGQSKPSKTTGATDWNAMYTDLFKAKESSGGDSKRKSDALNPLDNKKKPKTDWDAMLDDAMPKPSKGPSKGGLKKRMFSYLDNTKDHSIANLKKKFNAYVTDFDMLIGPHQKGTGPPGDPSIRVSVQIKLNPRALKKPGRIVFRHIE
jgi:hypothetical protein